ncbi:MAG: hypothetical protein LBH75_08360 [Treponema sp.]|jgi:hypothetical protein|nr:hypothetical protein [Treponema sp.]
MAGRKFIPGSEGKFLAFAETFCGATETHAEYLGIPGAAVTSIKDRLTAYTAAYNAANKPNAGKIDREDRKEKREALTESIRRIKNAYIDADPLGVVTDEIRMDFGLEPKDSARTDIPAPTEVAPFELANGEYLQIVVTHPARPEGYNGAVAFFTVNGKGPVAETALTQSKLLTRTREILTFGSAQLGQTLHISLRWQNEKGQLGPPSPIQSKVIS